MDYLSRAAKAVNFVAALALAAALSLYVEKWRETGKIDWPLALQTGGLLLLASIGVLDPPRGRWRFAAVIGIATLVIGSSLIAVMQR